MRDSEKDLPVIIADKIKRTTLKITVDKSVFFLLISVLSIITEKFGSKIATFHLIFR